MLLLPYENIVFTTKLEEAEITRRIKTLMEPEKPIRAGRTPQKLYEGHINGNRFSINKITGGRNAFRPGIAGQIESELDQRKVFIKMRLPILGLLFSIIWFGSNLLVMVLSISSSIQNSKIGADVYASIGFFLFGYIMVMTGFKPVAMDVKQDLKRILKAEILKG